MLHYELEKKKGSSLYEELYQKLKEDILRGRILPGTKLPSKRELARDNGISVKTVLSAYEQLVVEGYLYSKEKKGYFVAAVEAMPEYKPVVAEYPQLYREDQWFADFTANNTVYDKFPFSMWRKVMREVLSEYDKELVKRGHFLGVRQLRETIADYLYRTRGMTISPECIVIGASIEYLYSRLIKLLPADVVYAVENPGYKKIPVIYEEYGLKWKSIAMDDGGIHMKSLQDSGADIIHVSPEHHYPLGTVMSASRRQELLSWAYRGENRYVIEDDYDSEFRYKGRPIPALQGMDQGGRVIYMGTFSRSIAPAIRVGFMVLPGELLSRYRSQAGFYACTVSRIDQKVLYHFITGGYYERHLNRMRAVYKGKHDVLLSGLKELEDMFWIRGEYAGIHVLLTHKGQMPEKELIERAAGEGVRVYGMSEAVIGENKDLVPSTVILGYANLKEKEIQEGCMRLARAWK